jgi:5-methylcytosine-specific restriction endonuclease McrBC GTP-binding regulatory subunit McrB
MKFDKVEIEHINLAIKDFKEKGFPDGFKQSAYFNVKIGGTLYPPKPIMAYANFYATDEEPINNFSGGVNTPCFKTYERLRIPIIEKVQEYMSEENNSVKWSNKILDYLIQQRVTNPNLKFWLRQRNTNNRLNQGYWFNGTENYIHIGFTKLAAGNLSTQSLGFVIWFDGNNDPKGKIEIVFRNEKDQSTLDCYHEFIDKIGGFHKHSETHYHKDYHSETIFEALDEFLTMQKPIIDSVLKEFGLEAKFAIPTNKFEKSLSKILKIRKANEAKNKLNLIIANITWNSKDWKEISEDMSGHAWVGGDNIPHESWNFDYENPRNEGDILRGFVKFTNAPNVSGNNNLIIFYSQGKIVGFYGKTEVLKDLVNINEKESYNLIADKNLSIVLPNKIDDIKDKGYLEGLNRVGQVGFSYLKEPETAINILDEAIELNPEEMDVLEKIKEWINSQNNPIEDEERLIYILKELGEQDSEKFYGIMEQILSELSIKIGDKRICYSLPKTKKRIGLTFGQKLCAVIDRTKGKNRFRYFDTTKNETDWLKEVNNVEGLRDAMKSIILSGTNELNKTNKTSLTEYSSLALEKSLFDKDYKKHIFQKAFNKAIKTDTMSTDLNQIFFGPPGTGKTYHTINEAIKIVDPEFYSEHKDDRDKLKERFKLLLLNNDNEDLGQIGFTTFHQSFSYEDFIEGIKPIEPKKDDTYLKYEIQEGIFKKVCRLANDSLDAVNIDSDSLISLSPAEYEKSHFYKMSLGNTQDEGDSEVYDYCIENNVITIGFGNGLDFTDKDEKELRAFGLEHDLGSYPITAMNLFSNYLKVDDYVVISYGNQYVRAIGKVVGDYEFIEESPLPNNSDWKHFRKVEWLFTDKKIGVKEIYNKNLSQQTIYKLDKKQIKQEFFVKEKKVDILKLPKNPKNFVLIVDEINRGNVSSIFGELITLIEKDKRANKDEELSVILPYSKKEFKVPHNVYIIGTMNTADRSIEALDTALRRRFSFREMPPIPNLILTEGKLKSKEGMIDDIDVVKILKTMNDRIEKLIDKDHKIGHSYFLDIESEDDLKSTFQDKVIPLLEEYFFGDFGKISLVLGKSFITKETTSKVKFAKDNDYDASIANDLLERAVYEVTDREDWDFKAIYA